MNTYKKGLLVIPTAVLVLSTNIFASRCLSCQEKIALQKSLQEVAAANLAAANEKKDVVLDDAPKKSVMRDGQQDFNQALMDLRMSLRDTHVNMNNQSNNEERAALAARAQSIRDAMAVVMVAMSHSIRDAAAANLSDVKVNRHVDSQDGQPCCEECAKTGGNCQGASKRCGSCQHNAKIRQSIKDAMAASLAANKPSHKAPREGLADPCNPIKVEEPIQCREQ